MIKPINKVLVANRGEIAVRVIRTCQRLGISTAAVYSEADKGSPHVKLADEAYWIGPPPSRKSYLNMDVIIETAKKINADAIHPGYGFLSENDVFADKVVKAGLVFIGPSPESIRIMGNKLSAKKAAEDYNIPMVPGSADAIADIDEAIMLGQKIGFPLVIKAAAGGGGKGMRIVHHPDELKSQAERAISESLASFGDGSVFIEKYLSSPRHIEIQVMADQHGNCIHLFERECSIQRRHQKIVEEAPSSILTPEKRNEMGEHAIYVARSCQYTGAGTVEFLVDEHNHHYFLEMNTRLQVEHPVTEMITGLDLVEMQIRIAEGHALPLRQENVSMNGHAIELRIYAENASEGFIPSTGTLRTYRPPSGPGIRVDDGFEEGMTVPIHYDPMLSKLIAHGKTRGEAIKRLEAAITRFEIEGVNTTLAYGRFAITHQAFLSGQFDTHFVEKYKEEFLLSEAEVNKAAANFALWLYNKKRRILVLPKMDD
jgi:acetyl-CoA carboxylase biotin carboxylase subunit